MAREGIALCESSLAINFWEALPERVRTGRLRPAGVPSKTKLTKEVYRHEK